MPRAAIVCNSPLFGSSESYTRRTPPRPTAPPEKEPPQPLPPAFYEAMAEYHKRRALYLTCLKEVRQGGAVELALSISRPEWDKLFMLYGRLRLMLQDAGQPQDHHLPRLPEKT